MTIQEEIGSLAKRLDNTANIPVKIGRRYIPVAARRN
jgi:hypothetical protein